MGEHSIGLADELGQSGMLDLLAAHGEVIDAGEPGDPGWYLPTRVSEGCAVVDDPQDGSVGGYID